MINRTLVAVQFVNTKKKKVMVTTDLPAGPLRSCLVRLGRAFSARARADRARCGIVPPPRGTTSSVARDRPAEGTHEPGVVPFTLSTGGPIGGDRPSREETRANPGLPTGLNLPQSVAEHFCTGLKRDALTGCKILSYRAALYIPHR